MYYFNFLNEMMINEFMEMVLANIRSSKNYIVVLRRTFYLIFDHLIIQIQFLKLKVQASSKDCNLLGWHAHT